jgi:hypothetical protein
MSVEIFEPCTYPTAARLNAIGASQVSLHAGWIGAAEERLVPYWGGSGSLWYFRHVHRWLIYDSTGQIVDISGENAPVTINDPESGWGVKDLDTIEWLQYGALYIVSGCAVAYERREPPTYTGA